MSKAAGTRRELQVLRSYRDEGYIAFRTPASMGVCDVIAMRADTVSAAMNGTAYDPVVEVPTAQVLMVEVKANRDGGPFKNFGRVDREALRLAAQVAGAKALLTWWPLHGDRQDIEEARWP